MNGTKVDKKSRKIVILITPGTKPTGLFNKTTDLVRTSVRVNDSIFPTFLFLVLTSRLVSFSVALVK